MKHLFYRDIKGSNPRKRELSIEEVSDRSDDRIAKKWVCKYFVKDKYHSENDDDLNEWIRREKRLGCKKDYHILRHVDTKTGENKIVCKMLGEFFVVWRKTVYKIVYVNEIRVHMANGALEKEGERHVE